MPMPMILLLQWLRKIFLVNSVKQLREPLCGSCQNALRGGLSLVSFVWIEASSSGRLLSSALGVTC